LVLKLTGIKLSTTAIAFCVITSYINLPTRNCYNTKPS